MNTVFSMRPALATDLSALVALENRCFMQDRLQRRQFRWLMQKGHAAIWLLEALSDTGMHVVGYVLLLFHRGTALARIYSIALDPSLHGQRLGERLLLQAEHLALAKGCSMLRLEVRADNFAAVRLYQRLGYRQFGFYTDYYEDHADALRFQKRLRRAPGGLIREVPYYQQTLPFTCGPASLLMAMKAQCAAIEFSRRHELQIWREATTIFMTTGHGGCGPHGLALAAWRRGFDVALWLNVAGSLFIKGVRDPAKKAVLELVHQDFCEQLAITKVREHASECTWHDLQQALEQGGIPLVLISSWRFSRQKSPHWVVVVAMDEQFIYLHDPEVDTEDQKTCIDTQQVPVSRLEFARMACFGQEKLRTAVVIYSLRSQLLPPCDESISEYAQSQTF